MMNQADISQLVEQTLYALLTLGFLLAGLIQIRQGQRKQREITDPRQKQPWFRRYETLWGIICLAFSLGLVDNILFAQFGATQDLSLSILLLALTILALLLLLLSSLQLWLTRKLHRQAASMQNRA